MLNFRPHTLRYQIIHDGTINPANGDFIPGSSEWSDPIECRYAYNLKAQRITYSDGFMHEYSFEVFLDKDTRRFEICENVRLFDSVGFMIAEMPVQGYRQNQLGTKIWL